MIVQNEDFMKIYNRIKDAKDYIIDVETTGLNPYIDSKIIGVGIGCNEEYYYFPFRHQSNFVNLDIKYMKGILKILDEADVLIGYNIKFDLSFFFTEGFKLNDNCKLIDVIVMSRLCSKEHFPDLDLISSMKYFINPSITDNKKFLKQYKKDNKLLKMDYSYIPPEILGNYCIEDLKNTDELYKLLSDKIIATNQTMIYEMEIETTKTLYLMESYGMRVDTEYRDRMIIGLEKKLEEIKKEIHIMAGEEFNISSSQQVDIIFKKYGIDSPETTKKGAPSWNTTALFLTQHPLSVKILQYRSLMKLYSTYFIPYQNYDVIHASFNNWGTVTGRLSCSRPNLQNFPRFQLSLSGNELSTFTEDQIKTIEKISQVKSKTKGQAIGGATLHSWKFTANENIDDDDVVSVRRLFIAREGYTMFSFDFSQMEIRIFASYLDNPEVDKLMHNTDFDFHEYMAKHIFGEKKVATEYEFLRHVAKSITFGLIYGMGIDTMSQFIEKSIDEAKELKKLYFDKLEGSRKFFKEIEKKVTKRGFVFNRYHRRYYIDSKKSYLGVNYLIQGTTGDLVKDRMNQVRKYLTNKKSKITNQIHDELIIEISNDEYDIIKDIKDILEINNFGLPLKVDIDICEKSLGNKKKFVLEEVIK